MIIYREFKRSEKDDYILNIQPLLGKYTESIPILDNNNIVIGWKIQNRYE
jgi:hypothetical protein